MKTLAQTCLSDFTIARPRIELQGLNVKRRRKILSGAAPVTKERSGPRHRQGRPGCIRAGRPLRQSAALMNKLGNFYQQRRFIGKFAGLLLGINRFFVDTCLEQPVARGDEFDVCLHLRPDLVRQTGGTVSVASLAAVFDGDMHGVSPRVLK